MRLIILITFLTSSCSIVPKYRIERVKQCTRDSYGTLYCEDGVYRPKYVKYDGCSAYDAPEKDECVYDYPVRDLPWEEELLNEEE